MRIVVFGDRLIGVDVFRNAFEKIAKTEDVRFFTIDENRKLVPSSPSEKSLREYLGSTEQVISEIGGAEALVVQGAPVSDEVLAAGTSLKLVLCARGGPVNVDVAAATRRGIPVVAAPGKNAEAVAELALALMIMLARNVTKAYDHVRTTKIVGKDNYEGVQFLGRELDGKTLGLIGFGRVGSRVAKRAMSFGMSVMAYDPFLEDTKIQAEGIRPASFEKVLSESDYVSLHARESKENENLMGEKQFAMMKQGAYFINTARPSMVDEEALVEALRSGRLAGAGVDVVRYDPDRPVNPLVEMENAIVMPHIGGSTVETTTKGAYIVAGQLERYLRGETLETVINPETLRGT